METDYSHGSLRGLKFDFILLRKFHSWKETATFKRSFLEHGGFIGVLGIVKGLVLV